MAKKTNDKLTAIVGSSQKIIVSNSNEKYVVTTEDKLHLAYNEAVAERKYVQRIFTFFSIMLAFLIPVLTTRFEDILFFSGETICGFFLAIVFVCVIIIIYNAILAFKNRKDYSFDFFVKKVADKTELVQQEQSDVD